MKSKYAEKLEKCSDISEKKAVRDFIMKHFKGYDEIIGLAGPKIVEYIDWCQSKGFKNVSIFENDKETLIGQLCTIRKKPVKLSYGNITSIDPIFAKGKFLDLDFCSTVMKHQDEIPKFKDQAYCMTYSRRSIGTEGTIKRFFEIMGEKVTHVRFESEPVEYRLYTTESKSHYLFAPYWDTSPMCCIAKIN